jgi:hypothetical protein
VAWRIAIAFRREFAHIVLARFLISWEIRVVEGERWLAVFGGLLGSLNLVDVLVIVNNASFFIALSIRCMLLRVQVIAAESCVLYYENRSLSLLGGAEYET